MLFLLFLCLVLIWMISFILSKKDILSPPNAFCMVFMFCILFAIPNIEIWNLEISNITFGVIFLGIFSFCIGYYLIFYFNYNIDKNKILSRMNENPIFTLSDKKFYLFLGIQIITLFVMYMEINRISSNLGIGGSLSEKIFAYRLASFFGDKEEAKLATYAKALYDFCFCSSYFIMYKLVNDYFLLKKIIKKYIFSILLTMGITFLSGGRGESIFIIIGLIVLIYIHYMYMYNWNIKYKFSKLIKYFSIITILVIAFPLIGIFVIGRETENDTIISIVFNQLSIYISAPLKLLDMYLNEEYISTPYLPIGYYTFTKLYNRIAEIFNINFGIVEDGDFGFREINGVSLGNVYTIFRPFYSDAELLGVILFCIIIGAVFGYLYYHIKYTKLKPIEGKINYKLILYVYLYISIALSFFSEWFYVTVISFQFIKVLIYFKLFEVFFIKKYSR